MGPRRRPRTPSPSYFLTGRAAFLPPATPRAGVLAGRANLGSCARLSWSRPGSTAETVSGCTGSPGSTTTNSRRPSRRSAGGRARRIVGAIKRRALRVRLRSFPRRRSPACGRARNGERTSTSIESSCERRPATARRTRRRPRASRATSMRAQRHATEARRAVGRRRRPRRAGARHHVRHAIHAESRLGSSRRKAEVRLRGTSSPGRAVVGRVAGLRRRRREDADRDRDLVALDADAVPSAHEFTSSVDRRERGSGVDHAASSHTRRRGRVHGPHTETAGRPAVIVPSSFRAPAQLPIRL